MRSQRLLRLLVVLVPLIILTVFGSQITPVHAAGILRVDPPHITPQHVNTTFNVTVDFLNMDRFDGWDIMVSTNQSVMNPIGLIVSGTVFGSSTAITLADCINGRGTGCLQDQDGPGIAHSAVVALGNTSANGTGLLFTITYNVTGVGSGYIQPFNDKIVFPPTLVPHSTVPSVYGSPPPKPDFQMSANQTTITVTQGRSVNSTFQLDGLNSFQANVSLGFTEAIGGSVSQVAGLKVLLNSSKVLVSTGVHRFVSFGASTNASTPVTSIRIRFTGTSNVTGAGPHDLDIYLKVTPPGSFTIDASPGLLLLHASQTGNSTIIVASNNQFAGQVNLAVKVVPEFGPPDANATAWLNATSVQITPGANHNASLTVTAPVSTLPFRYDIVVTATSGTQTQSITVIARPPSPDFNFTVTPGSITTQPGKSVVFDVTLVSDDYFQNTVFLYASSLTGTKLSFSPSNLTLRGLEHYQEVLTARLNVTTDPTLSSGVHPVQLTATASDVRSTIVHTLNVNVTIERESNTPASPIVPKTIFGLTPVVYFAIVGAVAAVLAAATILERRDARRQRRMIQDSRRSNMSSATSEWMRLSPT